MGNRRAGAFTLIELIVVIAVIAVIAGLVLGTFGYVKAKAATSRAEAEIKALEAGCESYKADNGTYPRNSVTDDLDAKTSTNPSAYQAASLFLYQQLSGSAKRYMEFKPQMLAYSAGDPSARSVSYIRDPFGHSYGYSTAYAKWLENPTGAQKGTNPTFDLWSTAGTDSVPASEAKWIKNW